MQRRRFVTLVGLGIATSVAGCTESGESGNGNNGGGDGNNEGTTKNEKSSKSGDEGKSTTKQKEQSDSGGGSYSVKIVAEGKWSGTIMSGGSSKTVEGEGKKTFQLDEDASIVSANAQKKGANSNTLTIQIIKDGEVMKKSSTSAEYGMAQVSYSSLSGNSSNKKSGYVVKISYDGKWSGAVGGDGSTRTVEGSGTKKFPIKGDPFAISGNAQKRDGGAGKLTIQVLNDGKVIKESSTSAEYGMAMVTVTT